MLRDTSPTVRPIPHGAAADPEEGRGLIERQTKPPQGSAEGDFVHSGIISNSDAKAREITRRSVRNWRFLPETVHIADPALNRP